MNENQATLPEVLQLMRWHAQLLADAMYEVTQEKKPRTHRAAEAALSAEVDKILNRLVQLRTIIAGGAVDEPPEAPRPPDTPLRQRQMDPTHRDDERPLDGGSF